MRVIADSHAILWFVTAPHLLSNRARESLLEAEQSDGIAVSGASLFDLWYATQKSGVTRVGTDQFQTVVSVIENIDAGVVVLPVSERTAAHVDFASRNDMPDPWDRMIVATALEHELPLVTADKRIIDLGVVTTIW